MTPARRSCNWWPVAWALQRLPETRALPALLTFAQSRVAVPVAGPAALAR